MKALVVGQLQSWKTRCIILLACWLSRVSGWRFGTFKTDRIGHFIDEGDLMATAVASDDSVRHIVVMPAEVSNEQVRALYLRSFAQLDNVRLFDARRGRAPKILSQVIGSLTRVEQAQDGVHGILSWPVQSIGLSSSGWYPNARPTLTMAEDEIDHGWKLAEALTLSPLDKVVCLHIRDGDYLSRTQPNVDFSYHSYRNPPLDSYVPAVNYLLDKGYKVVRTGSGAELDFPVSHANFVDYARSLQRSDFLDVFIYSVARLAIAGGASGIDHLGYSLGCPTVTTNIVPFSVIRYDCSLSIVTPSLLRSVQSSELLPLSEMAKHGYGKQHLFTNAGLKVEHNSDLEILDAVQEAVDVLEGTSRYDSRSESDQLHFWSWVAKCGFPDAPLPAGIPGEERRRSRLSQRFLDKYRDLLFA